MYMRKLNAARIHRRNPIIRHVSASKLNPDILIGRGRMKILKIES